MGQEADTWSDIYSLGAVIYHAITHRAPSASGPTSQEIAELPVSQPLKQLLSHMLALESKERIQQIDELLSQLDTCQLPEIVPMAYMLISDQAINDLVKLDVVPNDEFPKVREQLIDMLGGANACELPMLLGQDGYAINVICESFELKCVPNSDASALVLNSVSIPWQPALEKRIESALPVRIIWEPIKSGTLVAQDMISRVDSKKCLNLVLDKLTTHNKLLSVEADLRVKRHDFADVWEQFLDLERSSIEKKAPQLHYSKFSTDGDVITFNLTEPAPDSLTWTEGTPLAVIVDRGYHRTIGKLESIRGNELSLVFEISGHRTDQMLRLIPKSGFLTISLTDALSAIRRQQTALSLFQSRSMASQTLGEAIIEPKRARFTSNTADPKYFQTLDVDKRDAVRSALAAKDIFLIQGPPGSGKTTVIAELIAQIRTFEPNARILMTSQSNVPVNHALAQVAKINGLPKTEMIRIGRRENIGKGAERWEINARLAVFRTAIVAKCETSIQSIKKKRK